MKRIVLFPLILLSLFAVSCNEDEDLSEEEITVTTLEATDVTGYSATFSGRINAENTKGFSLCGILFSDTISDKEQLKASGTLGRCSGNVIKDNVCYVNVRGFKHSTKYYYLVFAEINDSYYLGDVMSFTTLPRTVPEGAVDMGLSVFWADRNIGASNPIENGDYFAWGDIEPNYTSLDPVVWKSGKESGYSWQSYKWCNFNQLLLTKYNFWDTQGTVDNKAILERGEVGSETIDDVARARLGGKWRIPSLEEWHELYDWCDYDYTNDGQIREYFGIKSRNGNILYLPYAGGWQGTAYFPGSFYWTNSLDRLKASDNYYSSWTASGVNPVANGCSSLFDNSRCFGYSVRAVSD